MRHLIAAALIAATATATADTTATLTAALRLAPPDAIITSATPAILSAPGLTTLQRVAVGGAAKTLARPTSQGAEAIAAEWIAFVSTGRWQDSLGLSDTDADAAALLPEQRGYIAAVVAAVCRDIVSAEIARLQTAIAP